LSEQVTAVFDPFAAELSAVTEACNEVNALLMEFNAVCSAVRLVCWLVSREIGSDAICCARVMTWAKSLEKVLLPVKMEDVELLIRISQNCRAGPCEPARLLL